MKSLIDTHRDKLNDDYYWATSKLKEAFTNEIINSDSEWEVIEKIAADSALPPQVALCAYVNLPAKKAPEETRLTVLFVNKKLGSEPGFTGTLTLRLHFVDGRPKKYCFVPSKEMLWVEDAEFLGVFDTGLEAVLALDPESELDSDNYVIEWKIEFHEAKKEITALTGKSLGAGIAVGLLHLLKNSFSKKHQYYTYFDLLGALFKRNNVWGITGEVNSDGEFTWPENVPEKIKAKSCPHTVYVGAKKPKLDGGLTCDVIPILNLKDFVHRISLEGGMPQPVNGRSNPSLTKLALMSAFIVLIFLSIPGYFTIRHYYPDVRDIQEIARIGELSLPEGCKQIFELPDRFSQAEWDRSIYPALAKQQHPFALVIGNPDEWVDQTNPVSLDNLYKLQNLHTLTIHHSNVTSIPHLEKMIYLERLSLLGSSIDNIENCTRLQNLRTLVLDSGFIRKYPSEYSFPNLKNLILHVDETIKSLDLSRCGELKNLSICGESIESITGLAELQLEKITIHAPNLQPTISSLEATIIPETVKSIKLVGFRKPFVMDLNNLPVLSELSIRSCDLRNITPQQSNTLESIEIYKAHELRNLNLSSFKKLKRLVVSQCPIMSLQDLKPSTEINDLHLKDMPLADLTGIENFIKLSSLDLRATLVTSLPKLTEKNQIRSFTISETPLSKTITSKLLESGYSLKDTDEPDIEWTGSEYTVRVGSIIKELRCDKNGILSIGSAKESMMTGWGAWSYGSGSYCSFYSFHLNGSTLIFNKNGWPIGEEHEEWDNAIWSCSDFGIRQDLGVDDKDWDKFSRAKMNQSSPFKTLLEQPDN